MQLPSLVWCSLRGSAKLAMLLRVTDGCRDAFLYLNPEAQQSPREDVTSSVDRNDFVNANLKIPPSRACSADSWITSDMHSHDSLPDKHKLSLTASGSPVLECPSSETEHNKVEEATCESDSLWLRESLFPQMKELRTVNTSKWARSFYP